MAITSIKTTRDFVRIWFFWKIQAILAFCLIVFCICLYSITRLPVYETTAKVLLLPTTNDELVVSAGQGQRQYDITKVDKEALNTEVELIKSKSVINKTVAFFEQIRATASSSAEKPDVLDMLKLREKPLTDLEKKSLSLFSSMTVEPIYASNMISVSLESHQQDQVADVLNKILEIYLKHHKKMYSVGESEEFYNEQKEYYGKRLDAAREKLKEYNRDNSIANMDGQIQANIMLISRFNGDLNDLEIAIADNEARLKMVTDGLNISGDKITLSKEMRQLPIIVELARGLVPLLIKRTEISKTFTIASREYQQINDQIKMLRQEIKNESINASRTDAMETISLKTRRNAIKERLENLNDEVKSLQVKQQTLGALELDLQIAKQNYLLYGTKTEDSRLYAKRNQTDLSNVVITERATTPLKATSPNTWLAFQVSIFLGLFAALILPFILETMDHKLKTADDVESIFSIPVVCSYNKL